MNGKGLKPDGTEGQSVNMQMARDKKLDILLRLNKEAPEKWTEEQLEVLIEVLMRKRGREG